MNNMDEKTLKIIADEFATLLQIVGELEDPTYHMTTLDAYYRIVEACGVDTNEADKALFPEAPELWAENNKDTYCGAANCDGCDGSGCRPC